MADQKKQHINLRIYDWDISANVDPDQEALYRKAGTLLNEKLNAYFGAYKGRKDDKEIMCYAMIDIAIRFLASKERNDVAPYDKVLEKLTVEIEEVL